MGEGQSGFGDALRALGHLRPEYLAYVVGFLTIANAWMSDHGLFRLIDRADQPLVWPNTLLLLLVAFVPFPTALVTEYEDSGAKRAALLVYGATFTGLAAAYALPWRSAARDRRLVAQETPRADLDLIRRRTRFTVPIHLAAAGLSLLFGGLGPGSILLVATFYPLSFRFEGQRRTPRA